MAAQTRTVTGSVFDKADNQPVIGATIAVMSAQGTVRMARQPTWTVSSNWKYLRNPKPDLPFYGLYNDHDSSSNWKDNYTVYMENDSKQLNELVVTGYQQSTAA